MLIPAALQNQIGALEASSIKVKVVVEGANGPTLPDGEAILAERGIEVIPDILANAGGVTVSYYEWVQNGRQERWDPEKVDFRLEKAMRNVYRRVVAFARDRGCSMRIAAYALALDRLKQSYEQRRIFP